MKRTVYFPEIFELVGNAKTKNEKVAILHKFHNEKGFYDILRLCYDSRIKWVVTRKEIEDLEYERMDIPDYDLAPTTLFLEARRRLYNFTNVRQPPLKKRKVLQLIAGMFSVLHEKEVELFKQMVGGRIEERGLTEHLVREAFPGLLSKVEENKVSSTTPVQESSPVQVSAHNDTQFIEDTAKAEIISAHENEHSEEKVVKKPRKHNKGSRLDKHKEKIHALLKEGETKSALARKFKISLGAFNNWMKKNPLEE
jgi:hypothetical protein